MIHVLGLGAGLYIFNHFLNPNHRRGPRGEGGKDGRVGEQGLLGHRGEPGGQCVRGERGERGEQGEQGVLGHRGEQSIRGERGEQGERGDQGIRGEQGELKECKVDQKVNLMSDRLSKHILDTPSIVREVLMSKVTKEIIRRKMTKEKGVVSEELRKHKDRTSVEQSKINYLNLRKKLFKENSTQR